MYETEFIRYAEYGEQQARHEGVAQKEVHRHVLPAGEAVYQIAAEP